MITYKEACKRLWEFVDSNGGIPEDEDIIESLDFGAFWVFYFGVPNGPATAGRYPDYKVLKDTGKVEFDYVERVEAKDLLEYYDKEGKVQKVKWRTIPCYFTKKPDNLN